MNKIKAITLPLKGFTLAEVLVTLAIVGVLASMTIPTLLQSIGNADMVARLKKEYALLSQASMLINTEQGGELTGNIFLDGALTVTQRSTNVSNIFASKFNVIKNCGANTGCFYSTPRYKVSGDVLNPNAESNFSVFGKFITADGTAIAFYDYDGDCTELAAGDVCAAIEIDINAAKGPNVLGRDSFAFDLHKNGTITPNSINDCNPSDANMPGWGCTAKVLTEGAMNY